jgi:hypothetical protein
MPLPSLIQGLGLNIWLDGLGKAFNPMLIEDKREGGISTGAF